jgi:hypothetical protein
MELKTLQNHGNRRLLLVAMKCVIAAMMIFCAIGIASADGNETDTTPIIPAVSLDKILDALYTQVAGWFKQIVGLMILAGGIYYIFGRSDEARAAGVSHLKRPVEAVIAVIGLLWFVNWLFTL